MIENLMIIMDKTDIATKSNSVKQFVYCWKKYTIFIVGCKK